MNQIDSLPFEDLRPRHIRPKIGFVFHDAEMLYHFEPVLRLLDPAQAELIRFEPEGPGDLAAKLAHLPHASYDAEELLAQETGYKVLVSHHLHGPRRAVRTAADGSQELCWGFLIRMLGHFNVRFMYGMGSDHWNMAPWNDLYDAFLCHGPLQMRQLAAFRGEKLQMGYPRYDAFFCEPFDRAARLDQLGCDPARPVVVWLPTLKSYYGTLDRFAEPVSRLMRDYNVLVKPHPFAWRTEPEYVASLERLSFTRVLRDIDNLNLFRLADYVLCDYGGSPFSALYTGCRLLLLDHPEHADAGDTDPLLSGSEQWLRHYVPHLGEDRAAELPGLLASRRLWKQQEAARAWLQRQCFSPGFGYSAQIAAQLLKLFLARPAHSAAAAAAVTGPRSDVRAGAGRD